MCVNDGLGGAGSATGRDYQCGVLGQLVATAVGGAPGGFLDHVGVDGFDKGGKVGARQTRIEKGNGVAGVPCLSHALGELL